MTMVKIDRGHSPRAPRRSSRRERKKLAVRESLYDVALELFRSRGYEATTVREICEGADVAKGTFFNYFPSKEHVLVDFHDRLKSELLDRIERLDQGSAQDAVRVAFIGWAELVEREPELGRTLVRVMLAGDVLSEADAAMEERLLEWLRARLSASRDRGDLDAGVSLEVLIDVLLAVLAATSLEWARSPGRLALGPALEERCDFVFRAARSVVSVTDSASA